MPHIHGLAVHQRTAAHDALDTTRFAFRYCFAGDAAGTEGPMEPDLAHALFTALADNVRSVARVGGDYDAID